MLACRLVVALALLLSGATSVLGQAPSEYDVKAAFLFNFVRFVEWPAPRPGATTVDLCVLGPDPFGAVLDRTLAGKQVAGRPLEIRRLADPAVAVGCDIVFVGDDAVLGDRLLAAVGARPVLTVGEAVGFADRGGIVQLVVQNAKVGIRINARAASHAGLRVSSQLLKLAEVVGGD